MKTRADVYERLARIEAELARLAPDAHEVGRDEAERVMACELRAAIRALWWVLEMGS